MDALEAAPGESRLNANRMSVVHAKPLGPSLSRAALKKAFDAFDTDGSGAIDRQEMTRMVRRLHLDLSAAEIEQLMIDADPDGSGEIDFEEFHTILQKQLTSGAGGSSLASVVGEASSTFGWLNPLTWVASTEDDSAPAPGSIAHARPARLAGTSKPVDISSPSSSPAGKRKPKASSGRGGS